MPALLKSRCLSYCTIIGHFNATASKHCRVPYDYWNSFFRNKFLIVIQKLFSLFYTLLIFGLISYVFSCWWDWSFGCSFGGRNFVEYLALFSIPVAFLFQKVSLLSKPKIVGFWIIVILFIGVNMKLIYSYDECFEGARDWDWQSYIHLVLSPTK